VRRRIREHAHDGAWAVGAAHYNVQIFRGREDSPFGSRRSWTYEGWTYRLSRCTQQRRVWPDAESPSAHKYRPLLGHSTFVARRTPEQVCA
jgi:hypothetical protein